MSTGDQGDTQHLEELVRPSRSPRPDPDYTDTTGPGSYSDPLTHDSHHCVPTNVVGDRVDSGLRGRGRRRATPVLVWGPGSSRPSAFGLGSNGFGLVSTVFTVVGSVVTGPVCTFWLVVSSVLIR